MSAPERTLHWGLYNWDTKNWIGVAGKRDRFPSPNEAGVYAAERNWGPHVGPRPFYVRRKRPPVSVEAKAVIDAVRDYLNELDRNECADNGEMRSCLLTYDVLGK